MKGFDVFFGVLNGLFSNLPEQPFPLLQSLLHLRLMHQGNTIKSPGKFTQCRIAAGAHRFNHLCTVPSTAALSTYGRFKRLAHSVRLG
jgi:hypothetical protein